MQVSQKQTEYDFHQAIPKHKQHLMNYALYLSKDRDFADDLVQITMYKAWKSRHSIENVNCLRSWMSKILFHEYVRIVSNTKYQSTLFTEELSWTEEPYSEALEQENEVAHFIERVTRLPTLYREPILLFALGYKNHEIAEHLTLPPATVLTRVFRARQMIKERYQLQQFYQ